MLLRPRTTSVVSTSVGRWSAFNISIERPSAVGVELVALLEQHDQLLEEPADALGVGRGRR